MVLFDESEVEGHHRTAELGQLVVIAHMDWTTEPRKLSYKPWGGEKSQTKRTDDIDVSFKSIFWSSFYFYHKFTLLSKKITAKIVLLDK